MGCSALLLDCRTEDVAVIHRMPPGAPGQRKAAVRYLAAAGENRMTEEGIAKPSHHLHHSRSAGSPSADRCGIKGLGVLNRASTPSQRPLGCFGLISLALPTPPSPMVTGFPANLRTLRLPARTTLAPTPSRARPPPHQPPVPRGPEIRSSAKRHPSRIRRSGRPRRSGSIPGYRSPNRQ